MTRLLKEHLQAHLDLRKENEQSDYSEAEVQQWVDDLGQDKPFDSIEALNDLLKSFNETLLQRSSRFSVLEILRPVVDRSLPYLTASYERRPWPLSANGLALATQVEEVLDTFFIGYALCAVEKSNPSNRGRILHRTLDFGCRKCVEQARRYRSLTQAEGELIFEVYRQARQEESHAIPVEPWDAPEINTDSARLSIEKLFIRFLILLLLKPASWWPGDAEEIYARVGEWLNDIDGLVEHPPRKGEFVFAVDIDHPGAPLFFPVPAKASEERKNTLYLVLDDVVARLRKQPLIIEPKGGDDASALHPTLNQRLVQMIEKSTTTESPTKPALYPNGVTVIQGFEVCQRWFSHDEGAAPPRPSTKKESAQEQGIAIQVTSEQAPHLQVGDLMAWHEDPSAPISEWQLAEIAWMITADNEHADVGLRFLRGIAQGGVIQPVMVSKKGEAPTDTPCLMFTQTAQGASKTEMTVLALPGALALGAMLELKLTKQIHLIELTQLQRQTARFAGWKATRIQTVQREPGV